MKDEELKKIIYDMFYDYDNPSIQKGAMECLSELMGEGYRQDSPYLKAYIFRKLLGTDSCMFVIKYGEGKDYGLLGSSDVRIPKYYFTIPELFFTKQEAYNFAKKPPVKYANLIGKPFCIDEI